MGEVLRFHVQDSMINQICEIDADQLNAIETGGGFDRRNAISPSA